MLYSIGSTKELFGVLVNAVGFSADPNVTRFGPWRRNQTIIHYCIKGTGYYNGTKVTSGQGFLIYPGDEEEYHPDKDDPWSFIWIILTGNNSSDILRYFPADTNTQVFSYDYLQEMQTVSQEIIRRSRAISFGMEAAELFLKIMNIHFQSMEHNRKTSYAQEYAKYAKNYLSLNYHTKITIHGLAEHLGISQPYLYRVFTQEYGVSPKQYLSELRLNAAKYSLQHSQLSISEIGKLVGYDDVLRFSTFFSDATGVSPQKYRAEHSR